MPPQPVAATDYGTIDATGATLQGQYFMAPYVVDGKGLVNVSHLRVFRASIAQGQITVQATMEPNTAIRSGIQCLQLFKGPYYDQVGWNCGDYTQKLSASTTITNWDETRAVQTNCAICPPGVTYRLDFSSFSAVCSNLPCSAFSVYIVLLPSRSSARVYPPELYTPPTVPVLDLTRVSRDDAAKALFLGYGLTPLAQLSELAYDGRKLTKIDPLPSSTDYPAPGTWYDTSRSPATVAIDGNHSGLYELTSSTTPGQRMAILTLPSVAPGRHELELTAIPYPTSVFTFYGVVSDLFYKIGVNGSEHYGLAAPFIVVEPRFWLGQAGAAPGGGVAIGGTGFAPSSSVSVTASDLCSLPLPPSCRQAALGSFFTDTTGAFEGSITMPVATSAFFTGKPAFAGRIVVQVDDKGWLQDYPDQSLLQQQSFAFLLPGVPIPPTQSQADIPGSVSVAPAVTVTVPTRGGFGTVRFQNVTGGGSLGVTATASPPAGSPPSGFRFLGGSFDLTASGVTFTSATVCLPYRDEDLPAGTKPGSLKLFHFEGGVHRDVTTTIDAANHVVCGRVSSLSPFAIGGPGSTSAIYVPATFNEYHAGG